MRDIDADLGIEQRAGEIVVVPAPAEPNCILEPFDFNSAMNSRRSLAGKSLRASSTIGCSENNVTGVKSLIAS